jgi:uncharacterized membrane protein
MIKVMTLILKKFKPESVEFHTNGMIVSTIWDMILIVRKYKNNNKVFNYTIFHILLICSLDNY